MEWKPCSPRKVKFRVPYIGEEVLIGTVLAERMWVGFKWYKIREYHPLEDHYVSHPDMKRSIFIVPINNVLEDEGGN